MTLMPQEADCRQINRFPFGRGASACWRCVIVAAGLLVTGCDSTVPKVTPTTQFAPVANERELQQELDEVLEYTFHQRQLSLRTHAAWQILHGALAYQREFPVEHNGQLVSAVDHILAGGAMKGWSTQRGDLLNESAKRYGLRALLESGTKAGQGHSDQWLAVLAQCELPADQPIIVNGWKYTMADFVEQVQRDVPRNVEQEYSWTLIGLTSYLSTDAKWIANDGNEWSIEKLMEIEAEQELNSSACGGTHRLIGMVMAINRRLVEGKPITGGWAKAEKVIQNAVKTARQYQNPDGSFSTNYFARTGFSPGLAQNLSSTGHILEFLTLALTEDELRQGWVQQAALKLCDVFRKTEKIDMECGALYHAAHGLALYRERLFGKRTYRSKGRPATVAREAT